MFLRSDLGHALEALVLLSTLAAFGAGLHAVVRPDRTKLPSRSRLVRTFAHPFAQLLLVSAIVWVNQVLFDAYVLTAHHGSVAFAKQYVGWGWFAIAKDDALVRFVAARVGSGAWLSPTLFRVQAFLELPFTLFAYLAVARLLGRDVQRALVRPVPLLLASLSFSATFSVIEVLVANPWTNDDLVLRALSALVTPFWITLAYRLEGECDERRPTGVLGLFAFLAGAGGVAYLVLAAYDALLLYNLAHAGRYAMGSVFAVLVVALASFATPRVDAIAARYFAPSAAMDAMISALRTFTVLFFIPSLAIRYWGGHAAANAAGVLLVVVAAAAGFVAALRRASLGAGVVMVVALSAGIACGGALAWMAFGARAAIPELILARVSLAFLAGTIGAARIVEFALSSAVHEAKAQADEA